MTETRWECWEIEHDGEGERGRRVVVHLYRHATIEDAAEAATERLDEEEINRSLLLDGSDLHGTSKVIEVVTDVGPRRFRVACAVVRKYRAVAVPG
jgi:hypothetical protein